MKNIIIVGSGDLSKLAVIRDRFPEAEVITLMEAKERGLDIDESPRISDIPIHYKPYMPILGHTTLSRNMDAQLWKRRGKNNKV